jgi:hypothetical protein
MLVVQPVGGINPKTMGVCMMQEHQSKYVDTITLIALVLMLFSGAMAVQRYLTAEQPGLAPNVQFATLR